MWIFRESWRIAGLRRSLGIMLAKEQLSMISSTRQRERGPFTRFVVLVNRRLNPLRPVHDPPQRHR